MEIQRIPREEECQRDLHGYCDKGEQEICLVKQVLEKTIRLEEGDKGLVEYWIEPSNEFSGDLIAAARTPSNNLHIILADVRGHGLSAALTALPIAQAFYSMTDKGFSLVSIIEEMNWQVNTGMPTGYFAAATMVSIDMYNRTLEIWNGGNPPSLLVNQRGEIINQWKSRHPPLGILNKGEFNTETEVFSWDEPCQLVIYSDGLVEAENLDGKVFDDKLILQALFSATPKLRFSALVEAVKKHLAGRSSHDDISLVMIDCSPSEIRDKISQDLKEGMVEKGKMDQWKWMLHLGPERLKNLNTMRVILDWLHLMGIKRAHTDRIFVIISELYANALDHGVLRLDSRLLSEPEGFEKYMCERQRRLVNLHEGYIDIEIGQMVANNGEILRIRVKDSGPGFDYAAILQMFEANNVQPFGRGILIVMCLSSQLTYLGKGNEVVAYYPL
ncbi:MAG: SpoIIE family protein phosphatase [Nitrospirae bacterium]|nr:SpoIIE family protein phosphatase [Nitrospirota bacterium]